MGMREAIFFTMILGIAAAATADAKPTRSKPAKPPAADAKATDAQPAERPDPGAGAGSAEAEADREAAPRHVVGPRHVDLGSGASIEVPAGYWLFERAEAQELARKMGNAPDSIVATIVKPDGEWLIVIHHHEDGYIDDSDANDLDADDLLDAIRTGTT